MTNFLWLGVIPHDLPTSILKYNYDLNINHFREKGINVYNTRLNLPKFNEEDSCNGK